MSLIKSRKHALAPHALAALAALSASLPLAAQTAPAADAKKDEAALPAVKVRAGNEVPFKADSAGNTKFTAPLVDTPKSVTVVPKQVLEETNARSVQEALRTVPGITFGQGEGGTPTGDRPFIRGYDSQTSMYIDGLRDPGSQSRDVFNIEQVDVVKGSDSAFGGAGSTGGSINLTSKQARRGNSGAFDLGLGTARYKRVTADLNQQIGETTAVRVNAMREKSGVAGRDAVFDSKTGAALSFSTGLGTPTQIGVDLYSFKSDGLPDYGIPFKLAGGAGTPNEAAGLNSGHATRDTVISTKRENFYGLKDRDFRKTGQDSGTLRLEHRFDEKLTLRNRTRLTQSYNDYIVTNPADSAGWYNADPTPTNLTDTPPRGSTRNDASGEYLWRSQKNRNVKTDAWINQTEIVGDFDLGGLRNSYTAGLEISSSELDSRGYTVTGNSYAHIANPNPNDLWNGVVGRATAGNKTKTDVQALYAFDTLTVTEHWLVNLGLRYDHFKTRQTAYNADGAPLTTAQQAQDIKSDANLFNYQVGVVFKPASNGSIYLSLATSASPSGFASGDSTESAVALTNKDLDPEKTRSLELGTKWELLDNRLSVTAAIFDMKKTNAKVTNDLGVTATVGEQAIKGVELGVTGAITPAWNLSAGYTYLDSELVDGGYSCTNAKPPVCTPSANNGKQFANTPKSSFTLWSTYTVAPGLQLGAGASHVDKVYSDPANTVWLPAHTRFDAMVSYQINKNASVRLNISNLTDKTYYERPQNPHMAYVAPGRQFILTGSYKF
ncbi:MAG: TonB-dependent siderophore receptor [Roseateles sp.]|uniref:TonB-dependent receptor n=1 Tax=Roseateles sp. TaxID=1971397 RepID=UPI0039EBCA66